MTGTFSFLPIRRHGAKNTHAVLLLIMMTLVGSVSPFGLASTSGSSGSSSRRTTRNKASSSPSSRTRIIKTVPMSEIAEAVNGEIYLMGVWSNETEATDELLAKRVPIAIRYPAESGMKPYFLTVAKKLKEAHPDIILDKVILPKVVSGDGDKNDNPIFEVLVDGKVVVPTLGRKDRDNMGVFVSMNELDAAISRARRRRRPSTVYGDEAGNLRPGVIKTKPHVKHSKD